MKKGLLIGSVAAALLIFTGCETATDENNTTSSINTISGVVADGYIKDAKVCLDLNKDGLCGSDEPVASTNENGEYSLEVNASFDASVDLIASGGIDLLRNVGFTGILKAPALENANITPLTTVVKEYMNVNNVSFDVASNRVAQFFGISSSEVLSDPTKDDNLQSLSLELELSAELISDLENMTIKELYSNFAKALKDASSLDDLLNNLNLSENTIAAVKALISKIPEYVENKKVADLENVKSLIKDFVVKAKGSIVTTDDIISYLNVQDNTLSFEDFTSRIEDYYTALKLAQTPASVDDAKALFKVVRDTIYEGYDFNNEDNTTTIFGEVKDAYKNAITPAVEDLNNKVSYYTGDYLNRVILEGFKDSFDGEYNTTINALKNRISAITDEMSKYSSNMDYNFTTSFNDKVVHKYEQSDNLVTEIYSINDQNITATYDPSNVEGTLEFNGSLEIKDENYSLSLNKIFEGSSSIDIEGNSGWIKGSSGKTINITAFKITANIDKAKFSNEYDSYTSVSSPDIELGATLSIPNGSFEGKLTLTNSSFNLLGKATYLDASFDGNLTLNMAFDDALVIARDKEFGLKELELTSKIVNYGKLYLVNNKPVMKTRVSNYEVVGNASTSIIEEKYDLLLSNVDDENLTCKYDVIYNNPNQNGEDLTISQMNVICDDGVSEFDITNFKKVVMDINGTSHYLSFIRVGRDMDVNDIYYYFKDGSELIVVDDSAAFCDYRGCSKDFVLSSVSIDSAKTIFDVPADITFVGSVKINDLNANLSVASKSIGDGSSFEVYANNVSITDTNTANLISLEDMKLRFNNQNSVEYDLIEADGNLYIMQDLSTDTLLSSSYIKGINATLYDSNSNPLKLESLDLAFNTSTPVKDEMTGTISLDGNISYLDFKLNGFSAYDFDNDALTFYLDIQRTNYAPFTLGLNVNGLKSDTQNGYFLISRDTDILAGKFDVNESNFNANVITNRGVIVDVNKTDDTTSVVIKDSTGKELATFNPITNTITYSDGSSETLY